jgi:uncharacterized RDD family membrane protein YckC
MSKKTSKKPTANKAVSKSRPKNAVKKSTSRKTQPDAAPRKAPAEKITPKTDVPAVALQAEHAWINMQTPETDESFEEKLRKTQEEKDFYLPLPEYDDRYRYVGLQKRLLAQSFDLLLYAFAGSVLMSALALAGLYQPRRAAPPPPDAGVLQLLMELMERSGPTIAGYVLLAGVLLGRFGTTPGRWIMGIRMVMVKNAARPGVFLAILRGSVGYVISALPLGLGFFWGVMTYRKQALHDKIFGTAEVSDRRHYRELFRRLRERLGRQDGPPAA